MTTAPAPSIGSSALAGSAVGPFPTGFKYGTPEDVRVWLELAGLRQPDLTLTADYTLSGAAPLVDGGTITLSGALVPTGGWAAGDRLVWARRTVKRQALALPDAEGHKPRATEQVLDKVMRAAEEQADQQALALTVPAGEDGQQLPTVSRRQGRMFVGGAAGEALTLLEGSEQVVTLDADGRAVPMALVHVFGAIGTDLFDDGSWQPTDDPSANDDGAWG